MPRYARIHCPGAVVHVIARFVNKQYRLAGHAERQALLKHLPPALKRTDWLLLAYALMSNHVHLAMLAGHDPPWPFLKSLNVRVARWLNRAQGTFGPVFAERATTIVMPQESLARLVAYIHNNPVRAGVVQHPQDSDWTSHPIWQGRVVSPPWLEAARGLHLSGFDASSQGRLAFDAYVSMQVAQPRDERLSGRDLNRIRQQVRQRLGVPVELASTVLDTVDHSHNEILADAVDPLETQWAGSVDDLLRYVAEQRRVPREELCSMSRRREVVEARRVVLVAWVKLLGRQANEAAAALRLGRPSASKLLRRAGHVLEEARRAADAVRSERYGAKGNKATPSPTRPLGNAGLSLASYRGAVE